MAISRTKTQKQLVGAVLVWTTTSAPTGWLLCDGSAVSRTTYADLFALIGVGFGSGDGSTTFTLPDLRDKTTIGTNASIAVGATSTGITADASSTTSSNQSASHTHTGNTGNESVNHTHTYSKSGASGSQSLGINSNHTHAFNAANESVDHTHTLGAHTHTTPDRVLNFVIKI